MAKAIRANSEYFDLLAGDILNRLNIQFPEPIDLVVDHEVISHLDIDEDPERLQRLYAATIRWLADEYFLRFKGDTADDQGEGDFFDAVLSAKGRDFLLKDSRGSKLMAAAKVIGTEAGKKAISEIVGQAIGAAARGFAGQ